MKLAAIPIYPDVSSYSTKKVTFSYIANMTLSKGHFLKTRYQMSVLRTIGPLDSKGFVNTCTYEYAKCYLHNLQMYGFLFFWSFEISEGILRNQQIIIGLDSFSKQRIMYLDPFDYTSLCIDYTVESCKI